MKKLLVLLLFFATTAQAKPFLICSPDPTGNADTFAYQEGTVITRTPLLANACHADLAAATPGAHTFTIWFENSVWGTASAKAPFTYSRPIDGGTGPTNPGISAN